MGDHWDHGIEDRKWRSRWEDALGDESCEHCRGYSDRDTGLQSWEPALRGVMISGQMGNYGFGEPNSAELRLTCGKNFGHGVGKVCLRAVRYFYSD